MAVPTLRQLLQALHTRRISAAELTAHYLGGIAAHNPASNAFIQVATELAAEQAQAIDSSDQQRPLSGLPLAHKDIFCTQGLATTCASQMLHNFIAPYNATVVDKLNEAGTVLMGKTNMDEFAMGSSNENSAFGHVTNPWDAQCVPGGSSGGSAAAVAAGLTPVATGTDTGGSIRQPASFCGITGLKPTYGRVSRYGMIAFASSLDQGGPMAHCADDVALVLSQMAGFDPRDSTSAERQDSWLTDLAQQPLTTPDNTLRIGLPQEYFAADIDPQTQQAVQQACQTLEQAGHTLVELSLPHTAAAIPAYYVIAGAEASTNLSRYDGVRFGHRCENPQSLEDLYTRSRSEGFGAEVKRRILTGTYALSVGYYDAYYLKAQKVRRLIANDFSSAFDTVDVVLTPTTPGPAFKLGDLQDDPVSMYAQDVFTVPASLAGLPALSMPCGLVEGLPVGVQLIGPAFAEDRILQLAHQFQTLTDWHTQTPDTFHALDLEGV